MAIKSIQKTGVYQWWRKKKAMSKTYNSTATGLRNISISKLLRTSQCVCSATSAPLSKLWCEIRSKYSPRVTILIAGFLICPPVTRAASSTTLDWLVSSFQLQSVVSNVHTVHYENNCSGKYLAPWPLAFRKCGLLKQYSWMALHQRLPPNNKHIQ